MGERGENIRDERRRTKDFTVIYVQGTEFIIEN